MVFAFPLQVGGTRLGVLDIFGDVDGSLTDEQEAAALICARSVTKILFGGQLLLTSSGDLEAGLAIALSSRAQIHQAHGLVMVALGVSATDALPLMRACAFVTERSWDGLASQIIAGNSPMELG